MSKQPLTAIPRLSIAPMMDWTDRHCRYFHRTMSRHTLLYTEMVTAAALVHGRAERLLCFVKIAAPYGYDEINLNVGCPSDRVQSGTFGAVLMKHPEVVRECMEAIAQAAKPEVRISVKCRIGVDEQEPRDVLPVFLETVAKAGVRQFTIHARKAWLEGLSPKQNRDVPPLDYPLVTEMVQQFAHLNIGINGGIATLEHARELLNAGLDHVMIGRAGYHTPAQILLEADGAIFGATNPLSFAQEVIPAMRGYIEAELEAGTRLHSITRHMLGLFAGQPGARAWRRTLSEGATRPGAGMALLDEALGHIARTAA